MSTPIDNGGPAFPTHVPEGPIMSDGFPSSPAYTKQGMTLRDWFAGQALQQFVDQRDYNNWAHERFAEARKEIAPAAYNIADAMLAARKEKA